MEVLDTVDLLRVVVWCRALRPDTSHTQSTGSRSDDRSDRTLSEPGMGYGVWGMGCGRKENTSVDSTATVESLYK